MNAGAWTPSRTPLWPDDGFGCVPSWMTSAAYDEHFVRHCFKYNGECIGRRHIALRAARHSGTHRDHGATRTAQNYCQRQRHGTDQSGGAQMLLGDADRLAIHRAGKADAERLRRVIQRQLPRRTLEPNPVLVPGGGPRQDHRIEGRLQPTKTSLIPRRSHAAGTCIEVETGNQGRMRSETNRRVLPKAGGKLGLRSIGLISLWNRVQKSKH